MSNISAIVENYDISTTKDNKVTSETLMKLLDESDLLQELMSNNSQLLEFLRNETVISMLIDLLILVNSPEVKIEDSFVQLSINENESDETTDENAPKEEEKSAPKEAEITNESDENESDENDESYKDAEESSPETPEEKKNRYSTLAAEILSADVWSLTDTVMESTLNLNKLWAILDLEPPLSINLATFFMKIMEHLLDMKCEEMITYLIDNQANLVGKFIMHLDNPPLMDFLLKLISTDKPDNSTGIIDFLQEQSLIPQLINALDVSDTSKVSEDVLLVRQLSAADFLKALITISANSTTDNSTIGPNELTRELVSHEMMTRLCNIMLNGGYALGNGVGIIIEIIRKNNSDYDILPVLYITLESHPPTGRDPIYLGHLLQVFGSKIDEFNKLLMEPKDLLKLKTTFGEIEPLGFERFKICELIAELLHCSNMALLNDNKGYDIVKIRDELRTKMKEIDPVAFKYNEVIEVLDDVLKPKVEEEAEVNKRFENELKARRMEDDSDYNDTIDSFNTKLQEDSLGGNVHSGDEDEPHANANLTEQQIRQKPVVGDYLKIALFDTQIISNILSMFFKFPWNNFLHNVVFDIVQQVLNGSMDIGFNKFLAIDIFSSGEITGRITESQKLCTEYEQEHLGLRLGYMGHLTLIAEEVVKFIQLYPVNTMSELIDGKVEDAAWESYVSNVLYDTRKKYNAILGGSDIDDDEGSNTFDESAGEIIDEGDLTPDLNLDSSIDHDLIGSRYDTEYKEEEFHEDVESDHIDDGYNEVHEVKFDSSDESESDDDDDHFASYMSQQLTNQATTDEFVSSLHSKVQEFNEQEDHELRANEYAIASSGDDDDDDYIDPNDDGMSYRKPNSLYDPSGALITEKRRDFDDDILLGDDSTSSSDSDDGEDGKTHGLVRVPSQG